MRTSCRVPHKYVTIGSLAFNLMLVVGLAVIMFGKPTEASLTIDDLIEQSTSPLELTIDDLINQYGADGAGEELQRDALPPLCGGSELTWLACAVYFEARNQSVEGQYFVAQVILNRAQDPRWPNTIEGVVRQGEERRNRCQFSFMCDGKSEHIRNMAAWRVASHVAVMATEDFYREQQVTCAHSYRADYVTSKPALRWFATLEENEQVGAHIFYCDKNSGS
jgi:spore germination cell wall hydrolase CwlJ-like protein